MPGSPPCGHTEDSCLPCHRRSWNPLDPDRRAAANRQAHHPLGCLRPIPDRIIFDELIQVLVFGGGCAGSPTPAARRPPAPPPRRMDQRRWPSSCAVRCWPPTTGCSAWSWSTWWWTAASPRRGQVAGPARWTAANGAEALDGHLSGRRPAGHAFRPANHTTTGCWRRRWTPSPWSACYPNGQWCTWTPATAGSAADRVLAEGRMVGQIATLAARRPRQAPGASEGLDAQNGSSVCHP
jgi:hypothetical protein